MDNKINPADTERAADLMPLYRQAKWVAAPSLIMTQIVRWIAQSLAALKGPSEPSLPADVKVTIGDAKRINAVIVPPIQEYLRKRGYDECMAGCGWRVNTFCVLVTLSRAPQETEVIELANMATPFPLAIEVAPDLHQTCEEIIRAAIGLGLKVKVIELSKDHSALPPVNHGAQALLPPAS